MVSPLMADISITCGPAWLLASRMAWRSVPGPASSLEVTLKVAAWAPEAASARLMAATRARGRWPGLLTGGMINLPRSDPASWPGPVGLFAVSAQVHPYHNVQKRIPPWNTVSNIHHTTAHKEFKESRCQAIFTREIIESCWSNGCNTIEPFNAPIKKAPCERATGASSRDRWEDCNRILPVHLGREVNRTMRMVLIRTGDLREKFQTNPFFSKEFIFCLFSCA